MKKVEIHCKTKYSKDYDSVIDVESIIFNAKENNERGIIFVDKDTIYSFTKIENAYNRLRNEDKSFNDFKVCYGVEITTLINNNKYQVVLLVNKQDSLNYLYNIINNYKDVLDIGYILNNKGSLLLGLIYDGNDNIDLSMFDYIEINKDINVDHHLVVYSNQPNSLYEGDELSREVLSIYRHIDNPSNQRLYKDTDDTLKEYSNKDILINNSNRLLDMIDNIEIIDHELHIDTIDNYDEFKTLVINSFNRIYKNPSKKMSDRLDKELLLTKELNYTYYFYLLMQITNYIKDNKETYLIDGYTNNSIISYVLGITNIEPYNLSCELFYSNIPSISIIVKPDFYYKKLFKYMMDKYNLIKCRYGFRINKNNVFRVIRNYEIKTHTYLDLDDKDYISNLLIDIPIFNDIYSNTYFLLPDNYLIPYTDEGTIYDYHDLIDNMINIKVLPNDNIKYISDIKICNNKYVYHLMRTIDKKIIYFEDYKYILENTPNLWFDDLVKILSNKYLIEDEVYNYLKDINIDDINIFNIINKLKENKKIIPKANLINKSYLAYCYVYNKYLSKE